MTPDAAWALGDALEMMLSPYDSIGNLFNDMVILLGFVGLGIWLRLQIKYTRKAKQEGTIM